MNSTTPNVNWSELDQKFWVNDGDDVLWFDSPLEAKDAARRIEIETAGKAERDRIVAWLREQDGHGYDDMRADAIEAGEHLT